MVKLYDHLRQPDRLWMRKVSDSKFQNEVRVYSFWNELKEFVMSTTLHCYKNLLQTDRSRGERFMWAIVHILSLSGLSYIIVDTLSIYSHKPLITSLYDTIYPVDKVPFPGIAICNINRISYSQAKAYAEYLAERDRQKRDVETILKGVRHLGKLHDFNNEDEQDFLNFGEFIYQMDDLPMQKRMRMLMPQCKDNLLRCFWLGKEFNCQDEKFITVRLTSYGYCCVFNGLKIENATSHDSVIRDPLLTSTSGFEGGFIVLLNGSSDDYFYPIYNVQGFLVQIFNPYEFSDMPSGAVSEVLIPLESESLIRVDAIQLYSDPDIQRHSSKMRQCLFSWEEYQDYQGNYQRSDCVINCRIRSMISLCGCIPFFLPYSKNTVRENGDVVPICSLEHLTCLNRYNMKWRTVVMELMRVEGLEKEFEDGLFCENCYSACTDAVYSLNHLRMPLHVNQRNNTSPTAGYKNIKDLALVRVYFGQPDTWLYKQSPSQDWFEVISSFGSMCGILTGFSIMSIVEVLYFIIKQPILRYMINKENRKVSPTPSAVVREFTLLP